MRSVPRWFVAAGVPDALVDAVVPLLEPLGAHRGVRWTRPDGWHVTLAYVGALETPGDHGAHGTERLRTEPAAVAGAVEQLTRAVRAGVDDARSGDHEMAGGITLSARGVTTLGDRALVLHLADEPAGALQAVAASVRGALRADGLPVDDKPLRAHVTLARRCCGAGAATMEAARRAVEDALGDLAVTWTIFYVGVWRSLPGEGRARYAEASRVALDGSD